MKILVISPKIPEQGKKGFQVLSYYRLRYLVRNHDVKIICFASSKNDQKAINLLQSFGIEVIPIKFSFIDFFYQFFRLFFSFNIPIHCLLYSSRKFNEILKSEIITHKPDLIYSFTFRCLVNLPSTNIPLFLDLVDSMRLNFSRRLKNSNFITKFFIYLEYQRIKSYENEVVKLADYTCVVSSIDREQIHGNNIMVLPLGVDTDVFYRNPIPPTAPTIIFSGNMSYAPNVESVLWFYKNCWFKIRNLIPDLCFIIAGHNPPKVIKDLSKHKAIKVTGSVDSIALLLNKANVSIAPMQSGSGMQFKILESMACGIPVVTTSLGFGDIKAHINRDILIADLPEEFINSIFDLFKSNKLYRSVSDSGLHFVRNNHSWDFINSQVEKKIFNMIKAPSHL